MKIVCTVLFIINFYCLGFSQEQNAEYPGGSMALKKFISTHIEYPQTAFDNNIVGKVIMQFIVEKDGSVTHISPIKDIGGGCAEVIAKAIKLTSNRWKPALVNNIPVRSYFRIPISFSLPEPKYITGKVIKIKNGNTLILSTNNNKRVKICLYGIYCPEKNQKYETEAKNFITNFCFEKEVKIEDKGVTKYSKGNISGIIWIDNVSLNEELLKNGLAWHYKKYNYTEKYANLENEARKNKLNIWNQTTPIAPWDFKNK